MSFGLDAITIIRLLLDYAPKTDLHDLELSKDTREEWITYLESEHGTTRNQSEIVDLSSLALYYATRKRSSVKMLAAEGQVTVDFWTLFQFAETVRTEEFSKTEGLLRQVSLQKNQRKMALARDKGKEALPSKHDWVKVANLERELLASDRNPRQLAQIIYKRLGVPMSTYREWRKTRKTTA